MNNRSHLPDTVARAIRHYGEGIGAREIHITWGLNEAANALRNAQPGDKAILIGMRGVDESRIYIGEIQQ